MTTSETDLLSKYLNKNLEEESTASYLDFEYTKQENGFCSSSYDSNKQQAAISNKLSLLSLSWLLRK